MIYLWILLAALIVGVISFIYFDKHWMIIVAVTTILIAFSYNVMTNEEVSVEDIIKQAVPDSSSIELLSEEPEAYLVYKDKEPFAYAVIGKANGYQSEMCILAVVELDGKIITVEIVDENETPSFINELKRDDFFSQFKGKDTTDILTIGGNVIPTTGATLSSAAIVNGANQGLEFIKSLESGGEFTKSTVKINFGLKEIFVILFMLMAVIASYKHKAKYRTIGLILAIIILGFWLNVFVTYSMFANLFMGYPPSIENIGWYILLFGTVIIVLLTGKNLYCYWICPFGGVQELLFKLGRKIGLKRLAISHQVDISSRRIPGFLAWLAIMLAILENNSTITSYEPFAVFFNQVGTDIQWVFLILIIITSLFSTRFYCSYFCPVGFIFDRIAIIKRKGARLWEKIVTKKQKTLSQ